MANVMAKLILRKPTDRGERVTTEDLRWNWQEIENRINNFVVTKQNIKGGYGIVVEVDEETGDVTINSALVNSSSQSDVHYVNVEYGQVVFFNELKDILDNIETDYIANIYIGGVLAIEGVEYEFVTKSSIRLLTSLPSTGDIDIKMIVNVGSSEIMSQIEVLKTEIEMINSSIEMLETQVQDPVNGILKKIEKLEQDPSRNFKKLVKHSDLEYIQNGYYHSFDLTNPDTGAICNEITYGDFSDDWTGVTLNAKVFIPDTLVNEMDLKLSLRAPKVRLVTITFGNQNREDVNINGSTLFPAITLLPNVDECSIILRIVDGIPYIIPGESTYKAKLGILNTAFTTNTPAKFFTMGSVLTDRITEVFSLHPLITLNTANPQVGDYAKFAGLPKFEHIAMKDTIKVSLTATPTPVQGGADNSVLHIVVHRRNNATGDLSPIASLSWHLDKYGSTTQGRLFNMMETVTIDGIADAEYVFEFDDATTLKFKDADARIGILIERDTF